MHRYICKSSYTYRYANMRACTHMNARMQGKVPKTTRHGDSCRRTTPQDMVTLAGASRHQTW